MSTETPTSAQQTPPTLARRILRGAAYLGVAQYGVLAIGIVKTIILARLVPVEYHGIVVLALSWVSFLHLFRLEPREVVISDPDGNPARLTTQYAIELATTLIGLVLGGLAYLLAPFLVEWLVGGFGENAYDTVSNLANPIVWQAIFVLLLLRVVQAATSTPLYILHRDIRQDVITRLTLAGTVLGLIVAVVLAWQGFPLASLLADAVVPPVFLGIGAWVAAGWRPALTWDRDVARDVFSFSFTLWTSGLLGKISFEFDDWLVGTLRGNRIVGFYGKAYTLAKMPMDVFAGVISGIALSAYAQSEAVSRAVLARVYRLMSWLLTRVVAWASIVVLAAAEEIVLIMLGPNWLAVPLLVRLMFIYVLGRPLYQNNAQLLISIRQERLFRTTQLVQAVALVLLAPPAVYFWGAEGASVAVSVMMLAGFALSQRYVMRFLDAPLVRLYGLPVLLVGVLTPLTYVLGDWLHTGIGAALSGPAAALSGGVAGRVYLVDAVLALGVKGISATLLFGGVVALLERGTLREVIGLVSENLLKRETAPVTD